MIDHECGDHVTTYRLRDWLISRQRFWGTPIPFLYDENDQLVPESFDNLPVELPKDNLNFENGNPLSQLDTFTQVKRGNAHYRRNGYHGYIF